MVENAWLCVNNTNCWLPLCITLSAPIRFKSASTLTISLILITALSISFNGRNCMAMCKQHTLITNYCTRILEMITPPLFRPLSLYLYDCKFHLRSDLFTHINHRRQSWDVGGSRPPRFWAGWSQGGRGDRGRVIKY